MKPVIVGVDIGSYTFKICVHHEKTFQILVNQANFRQTPSVVSFTQAERLVGEEAVNKLKSNYLNTIKSPMRLIGLDKSYELAEEELKNTTCKFQIEDELTFMLADQKRKSIEPEQILTALMTKVRKIISEHRLKAEILYLTVPSYLSQYERKIIKKCAQISEISHKTHIIEDWISIGTEYSYTRTKQLKNSPTPRIILIADIGHSKISLFVMQFTQTEMRLLDCEHLRFLGAKNMDHLMAQFYQAEIKRQRRSNQSIFSMPKACIKLYDQIQKQRKVLSANIQHQLHVQSLIEDDDFSYTMKRPQLQRIIAPVLDEINIALAKLKSRMPESIKLHSIELIGGASRIPIFRTIVQRVFGVQPSKTLNQSEALALGTAIYGAKESGLHVLDYNIINVNLVDIFACWSYSGTGNFLGENDALYKHRQIIFSSSCKVPSENIISFGHQGPVEMFIYYGQPTSRKQIGYVRFSTPNKIRFSMDSNKILRAEVEINQFDVYKFSDKKEKKWLQLQKRQKQLSQSEERLKEIYNLKNQYQSQLYALKNRLYGYKQILNEVQIKLIDEQLKKVESWLENEHTRVLGSEQDFDLYIIKLEEIKTSVFLQNLQQRQKGIENLIKRYKIVKSQAEKASLSAKNEVQARKLHFLMRWLVQSFQNMKQTRWEGYYLTQNSLQFAMEQLATIAKM